jgi:hypothetical protein
MQQITLKFKSAAQLWQFKQAIASQQVEINLKHCTLTCHCDEKEVALAQEKYGATQMIKEEEN